MIARAKWLCAALVAGAGVAACVHAASETPAPPPAGFMVAEIEVTDVEAYKGYAAKAGPVIAACGGRYLARGGRVESLEGPAPGPRFVIVRFKSFDAAKACYNSAAYQAIAPIRRAASKSRFWLTEGLPATPG